MHSSDYLIATEDNDPSSAIIDCQHNGWGFELWSGSYSIQGLTVRNCVAPLRGVAYKHRQQTLGGALFIESAGSVPNIRHCVFDGNEADIGGAIYVYSAHSVLEDVVVRNNRAFNLSGGVYVESGHLGIREGTVIETNSADHDGGGLYAVAASIDLFDESKIRSNTAEQRGSNVFCDGATINLYNDSDIEGDVFCDAFCYFHGKDGCSSNGGSSRNGTSTGYLVGCLVVLLLIVVIAAAYFWRERQKGDKYRGLLQE